MIIGREYPLLEPSSLVFCNEFPSCCKPLGDYMKDTRIAACCIDVKRTSKVRFGEPRSYLKTQSCDGIMIKHQISDAHNT